MNWVIDGRHQRPRQTYFDSGFLSLSHLSHLLLESPHSFKFVCDFTQWHTGWSPVFLADISETTSRFRVHRRQSAHRLRGSLWHPENGQCADLHHA